MDVAPLSQNHLSNARLFADRREMIIGLVGGKGGHIAEVGVAYGEFSEFMISVVRPSRFYAFDLFELHKVPMIWGRPSSETFGDLTHEQYYRERISKRSQNCEISVLVGDSSTNLKGVEDQLDLIYIDGDHEIDGVRRDTYAAIEKLKSDFFKSSKIDIFETTWR